jgi:general L-amino acid transport system substrate-binding protein
LFLLCFHTKPLLIHRNYHKLNIHKYVFLSSAFIVISWIAGAQQVANAGSTLAAIKERGSVRCGVSPVHIKDPSRIGQDRSGLDRLTCMIYAAAVLGDAQKTEFIPVSAKLRFKALQRADYDVLVRGTTWTLKRDSALGLHFAGINFYDGQGFIARKTLGLKSILDVRKASICVESSTTTAGNLNDLIGQHKLDLEVIRFHSFKEAKAAFFAGRCDLYTADRSTLAASRLSTAPNPEDYVVLPDTISKEPLGPVVRDDDNAWFRIVKWGLNAVIEAEERGISSANVSQMLNSPNFSVQRFLGVKPGIGKPLGLDDKWAYRVVAQVGNYAEMYDRTVGKNSRMALDRGYNALWKDGGLMYAPPLR